MTRARKVFAAAVIGAAMSASVHAQESVLPPGNLHFICAFAPGGGADLIVRYLADKMRPIAGRTIIVENRVGAAGNIAAEYVVRAKPDGLTVFIHGGSALAANMHLLKNPTFDPARQLQMVSGVNKQPNMLVVRTDAPIKTVAELTAQIRQKGEKATYATSNSSAKVIGEVYKQIAGLRAVEVSYKAAQDTLNDLLSGALDYAVVDNVFALGQARQGKLRILAISSGQRMQSTPDLPTMNEEGIKGLDLISWWAAIVPAGTPRPVVDQLNAWFNQIARSEETKKFFGDFGADPLLATPDELQAYLVKQIAEWGEYVKLAKIEPQ